MCRYAGFGERAHRLAGRRTGRQDVVDQHYLGVFLDRARCHGTGYRRHSTTQIVSPLTRCQAHRITHTPPHPQHGYHPAISQPTRGYLRHAQHGISAATPRGRRPARRGHQHQWPIRRAQPGQPTRQRQPERLRQIPAPTLLGRQHRPPPRPRIRSERPARHPGIGARPHPYRRAREHRGTPRTPPRARHATPRTRHRQDQIQQGPHRQSVHLPTDTKCAGDRIPPTVPRRRLRRRRRQPGSTGTAFAPRPGTSRQ